MFFLHISSIYAEILGETNFQSREFLQSGWKAEGVGKVSTANKDFQQKLAYEGDDRFDAQIIILTSFSATERFSKSPIWNIKYKCMSKLYSWFIIKISNVNKNCIF